jgi:hypothetical protein
MGFAWMNGGTPVRRSTTTHGPRCAAVTRATRRRARHHTNLVRLACLLEHPSRLADSVEAVAARQLSGGGRGERATYGEEAMWWRQVRQTGPGGECGAKEAAWGGSA